MRRVRGPTISKYTETMKKVNIKWWKKPWNVRNSMKFKHVLTVERVCPLKWMGQNWINKHTKYRTSEQQRQQQQQQTKNGKINIKNALSAKFNFIIKHITSHVTSIFVWQRQKKNLSDNVCHLYVFRTRNACYKLLSLIVFVVVSGFLRRIKNWESRTKAVIISDHSNNFDPRLDILWYFFSPSQFVLNLILNSDHNHKSVIISVWATHFWECFCVYSLRVSVFMFIFVETILYFVRLNFRSFFTIAKHFFLFIEFLDFMQNKRL